ncbi:hypothetical protein PENTCL1PPCAC_4565 [Pristionchus entomophagus]|uniref:Ribosomal protein n=1 Tax=Pristionchus entomophagus TaxID=358040 RepID=A0AAV5SIU3_9BILA|nr:hypothetical protein PENTCL1PPCAC_4565 [Pristionchus entomophagus]
MDGSMGRTSSSCPLQVQVESITVLTCSIPPLKPCDNCRTGLGSARTRTTRGSALLGRKAQAAGGNRRDWDMTTKRAATRWADTVPSVQSIYMGGRGGRE